MTIPFQRGHDAGTREPGGESDVQLIARLRTMEGTSASDGTDVAMARGRVWQRLVAEHPTLATRSTTVRSRRLAPVATGITAGARSNRRSPAPIGRRAQGGWRAAIDVAAVAVLIVGLVLSARGVGLMPNGGNPNPMTTQSVAASTPTRVAVPDAVGTNRQPGPGPRVAPVVNMTGIYAFDVAYQDDTIFTAASRTPRDPRDGPFQNDTDRVTTVTAHTEQSLDQLWLVELPREINGISDLAVVAGSIYIATFDASQQSFVTALDATTGLTKWQVTVASQITTVSSNGDIVLLSGASTSFRALDAHTGADLWSKSSTLTVTSGPVVAGDQVIYATVFGHLESLSATTGETMWSADIGDAAVRSAPVITSDRVHVIGADLTLLAFDRATGDQAWSRPLGAEGVPPLRFFGSPGEASPNEFGETGPFIYEAQPAAMALSGDQLIVGYTWTSGDLDAFVTGETPLDYASQRFDLVSVDPDDGTQTWLREGVTGEIESFNIFPDALAVDDERIYSVGFDTTRAWSLDDGSLVWDASVPVGAGNQPVIVDGQIYGVVNETLTILREPATAAPSTATPDATSSATPVA